jgi:hypothetical protein
MLLAVDWLATKWVAVKLLLFPSIFNVRLTKP